MFFTIEVFKLVDTNINYKQTIKIEHLEFAGFELEFDFSHKEHENRKQSIKSKKNLKFTVKTANLGFYVSI